MNNSYMRTLIGELEQVVSGIKLSLRSEYGIRHARELYSVKSSLVASHEVLCNIVYDEEHTEAEEVKKFWKISDDNLNIEEITEEEYQALTEKDAATEAALSQEVNFEHEDIEDPTTNDKI